MASGDRIPLGKGVRNIQRGIFAMSSFQEAVTISPVVLEKSFINIQPFPTDDGSVKPASACVGRIKDNDTLEFSCNQRLNIWWEVIEYE